MVESALIYGRRSRIPPNYRQPEMAAEEPNSSGHGTEAAPADGSKGGRRNPRPNYSNQEDRIIIEEALATKAYRNLTLFSTVATKVNQSPFCLGFSSERSVKDRFFKLLKTWRSCDGKLRGKSGTEETFGEMERMLAEVDAELKDISEEKQTERANEKKKQEAMRKADDFVVSKSTKRGGAHNSGSDSDDSSKETPSKKVKRANDEFGEVFSALREGDKAAADREAMRLDFEREEREKDRAERKEELKLVLDAVVACVSALKK